MSITDEVVDNTNLINITIAQLRGRQGFRQMCSVRKISLQSSFLLKLQGRSLVILFKEIAGQRSRVKIVLHMVPLHNAVESNGVGTN